jgi:CRP/FNR family cyclic AMP-dependent transcriptional regulator
MTVVDYQPASRIHAQGDSAETILYIHQGQVKLSVLSQTGKEAVVGMLGRGEFFGEGPLAGQRVRLTTATAVTVSKILVIPKQDMLRLLHEEPAVSDRFIAHMLARNIRLEEDLVDRLFNGSEKRLARTLLLLARHGTPDGPRRVLPRTSQEELAEMVGTTRSRVNLFMNKFRKRGFIDYRDGMIEVHEALTHVVLDEAPASDHYRGPHDPHADRRMPAAPC